MIRNWRRAQTAGQNRRKFFAQLKRDSRRHVRPSLYTLARVSKNNIGAPAHPRKFKARENAPENFGERQQRYREFGSMSISEQVRWAEREFIHAHVKTKDKLQSHTWQQLQMLLGLDGWDGECLKHACHAGTRRKLANKLARVIAREVRRSGRDAYFITIIHDDWRSPIRCPVVSLTAMKQKCRDCFKMIDFEGFAGVEFDILTRAANDTDGHILAPHIHGIGFFAGNRKQKLKQLRASRRLRSESGARTVVCRRLKTQRDVRRAAAYLLKPALWTKRPVPRQKKGGLRLVSNRTRQTFLLARLAEVLSYVGFKDLMITSGGKCSWMTDAVRMACISKCKRERWFSRGELDQLWKDYWIARKRQHFEPVKII